MSDVPGPPNINIRPAVPDDADGILGPYLESAEHHAGLDPERYFVPAAGTISARYREGRQHPADADHKSITFVAELDGEVAGFIDVRLLQSFDAMHRQLTYCHIAEIAVSRARQSQGIGALLMQAAEDWGRSRGAEFASLEYHVANARAGDFYQHRMGYHPASITAIKRLQP